MMIWVLAEAQKMVTGVSPKRWHKKSLNLVEFRDVQGERRGINHPVMMRHFVFISCTVRIKIQQNYVLLKQRNDT